MPDPSAHVPAAGTHAPEPAPPPAGNAPLRASAFGLARQIRAGEVSARAVVTAHIEHARRVNPHINAIVADRFDAAMADADAADRALAEGAPRGPLHGVPCTIKESFAVAGMPHTAGFPPRWDVVAATDSDAVALLRAAGAIPIGVTNTSELCLWMESNNRVYGRTRNPYDPARTAGGSSGGEGAIVGAGASPFGLAADIGGSIRLPAAFNGVFAHKPAGGVVPPGGQFPMPENDALRCLGTGPICRRAGDLMPLLRVLAGPAGAAWGRPEDVDLSGLDVVTAPGDRIVRAAAEVTAARDRLAHALADRGARIRRVRLPPLTRVMRMWAAIMVTAADTSYSDIYGGGRRVRASAELARWAAGRSAHTLPAVALLGVERVLRAMPRRNARSIAAARDLGDRIRDALGDRGVLLYPPYPSTAPRHARPLLAPVKWTYSALFNVLDLPVTSIPMGLGARGLPLGVQVVAPPGRDELSIAVALEAERAFGGWVPPARWFR